MLLRVEPKSDVPLYRQIMSAIQARIAAGRLKVGDRLPAVRELAVDLRINPNTVARAYRELDRLGIVRTRGAAGSFVRAGAGPAEREAQEQELRQRLAEALAAAASMDIPRERVEEILREVADEASGQGGGSHE